MTRADLALERAATRAIAAVRKGLPAGTLNDIAQLLAVDRALLLRVLGISERTLQRKRALSARLSPAASDWRSDAKSLQLIRERSFSFDHA